MDPQLNTSENASKRIDIGQMDSYMAFRSVMYKPSSETAHLRHILRFYIARALANRGANAIYILPEVGGVGVNVAAEGLKKPVLAICEPDSITDETLKKLDTLKGFTGYETVVLHSQFGSTNGIEQKFKEQIDSKQFRVMAVVPPPFDDVYEYDIWMFETTFRELFTGD